MRTVSPCACNYAAASLQSADGGFVSVGGEWNKMTHSPPPKQGPPLHTIFITMSTWLRSGLPVFNSLQEFGAKLCNAPVVGSNTGEANEGKFTCKELRHFLAICPGPRDKSDEVRSSVLKWERCTTPKFVHSKTCYDPIFRNSKRERIALHRTHPN